MEDLLAYLHFVVAPQVVDALIIGVALALVALGLTMIFGLLDVINLAHGDLYMLGGYAAFTLIGWGAGYWGALVLVPILIGLMSGMFLAALDQTIVATAIRTIGDELDGRRRDIDGDVLLHHRLVAAEEIPVRAIARHHPQHGRPFLQAAELPHAAAARHQPPRNGLCTGSRGRRG